MDVLLMASVCSSIAEEAGLVRPVVPPLFGPLAEAQDLALQRRRRRRRLQLERFLGSTQAQ